MKSRRLLSILLIATVLSANLASANNGVTIIDTLAMFEENDLGKWKAAPFAFEGDLDIREGVLNTGLGSYLSGVVWTEDPPARTNYEIELDAQKLWGSDFFLGLTIPVGDRYCTWIVGGWGGSVVGISNIDGHSADLNETTLKMSFATERWYHFKIRVLEEHIQCWIDGKSIIEINTKDRQLNLRPGQIVESVPLGISSYDTISEYRNMVWRNLRIEKQ
ncbi:MAG: DUF1080 domain-containing protein [Verrucomicrobia bacterium]|nr:DUF1080 domain-containing protein [Verrucomicrobiota bacterium]MDA1068982.1 DUF1080 domain-containing protein [Verrucomicrobiota bacterium]